VTQVRTWARAVVALALVVSCAAVPRVIQAQQPRVYRVGVILEGGVYSQTVDGLRDGLKEVGLEEGQQLSLQVHDVKGNVQAVAAAQDTYRRGSISMQPRRRVFVIG
jgi:hypothetical protein